MYVLQRKTAHHGCFCSMILCQFLLMKSIVSQKVNSSPTMSTISTTPLPPPCINNISDLVYVNGQLSATGTFYNCLARVSDPMMIPTFYNNDFNGLLVVNNSITFNNIESLDAVKSIAVLQLNFKMVWQDDRLAMPVFWNQMSDNVKSFGIDLTQLMLSNTSIGIWTPIVRFPDASSITPFSWSLRLNSSNILYFQQSYRLELSGPKFNFREYPADCQSIDIRALFFTYPNSNLIRFGFWGNPIVTLFH